MSETWLIREDERIKPTRLQVLSWVSTGLGVAAMTPKGHSQTIKEPPPCLSQTVVTSSDRRLGPRAPRAGGQLPRLMLVSAAQNVGLPTDLMMKTTIEGKM